MGRARVALFVVVLAGAHAARATDAPPATLPTAVPSSTTEAHILIGTAAMRELKQDWAGAEAAARAAIALDKLLPDAWHLLAFALERQNRPTEAAAAWEEALLLEPEHAPSLEWLGRLYAVRGELGKADALLQRLRPLDDMRAATLEHVIERARREGS